MNTLIPVAHMLDALAGNLEAWNTTDKDVWHTPRADILEGAKEYRILMDLPGVRSEDLDIRLEGQTLTVQASRASIVPDDFQLRRHERPGPVSFSRSFNLGATVDAAAINARLEQGVLQVSLPKSEKSLPRRIEVR